MIGEAWNIDDPTKPWALFDVEANIPIPIGLDDWLGEIGATYGSHTVLAAAPLECANPGTYSAGTILVRMKLAPSPVFSSGSKYPFTIRVVGADGITQDDRTLWLRVVSR
jgi:hypothetical protein